MFVKQAMSRLAAISAVSAFTAFGSSAALAQGGITIDFQLLEPTTAAVPLGSGVVIGALVGIVASVFLFRRRAAVLPLAMLGVALGGLLGGTVPGVARAVALADLGPLLLKSSIDLRDDFLSAQGAEQSPEAILAALRGKTYTASVGDCSGFFGTVSLTNPFVGAADEGQFTLSLSLFPEAHAVPAGPESLTAVLRIVSISVPSFCANDFDTDGASCTAGTTLQPGESCTVGVARRA